jgi:hypothetical protein
MASKAAFLLVKAPAHAPPKAFAVSDTHKFLEAVSKMLPKKAYKGTVHFIDCHNVLDLYGTDDCPFDRLEGVKVCLSWVGNVLGKTATDTIPELQARIASKQIDFAVFCSVRGAKPRRKKKGEPRLLPGTAVKDRAVCTDDGSKASVIADVLANLPNCSVAHFYDDALDHLQSAQALNIAKLVTHHIRPDNTPTDVCALLSGASAGSTSAASSSSSSSSAPVAAVLARPSRQGCWDFGSIKVRATGHPQSKTISWEAPDRTDPNACANMVLHVGPSKCTLTYFAKCLDLPNNATDMTPPTVVDLPPAVARLLCRATTTVLSHAMDLT